MIKIENPEVPKTIKNSDNFNADWIAPYVEEALCSRQPYIVCMNDIIIETLWYIFTTNIGEDIALNIAYNDCVDYVNDNGIKISKNKLETIIAKQLPWHYSYREAIDSVKEYIFKAERADLL